MDSDEFAALENIELAACVDWYRAAPADVREAAGIAVHPVGGATCLVARDLEPAMIFRRALGIGVGHDATESQLDTIVRHMQACGQRWAIPIAPAARPGMLASWVERRGFSRGYAWMKFWRNCDDPRGSTTRLDVRTIDAAHGEDFGQVVTTAFGLPPSIGPWIGALAGRRDWAAVMAFDGVVPVAAGALYVRGDHAWLGFGGTLPSHRRHGAQAALLSHRIAEAAARGARMAVTETGERLPDRPSNSYRNILRAGFREAYLRQNYLSPAS